MHYFTAMSESKDTSTIRRVANYLRGELLVQGSETL